MKKTFAPLANYIHLFNGYNKPRLNFQELYRLFPDFTFTACKEFGQYSNFNQAFESKNYSMIVTDQVGNECYMTYREYYDTTENLAYVS